MNRGKTVIAIAPVAPPCFQTRGQWLEYVAHAASYQRGGHAPGPLTTNAAGQVVFNRRFRFCDDCTKSHRADMEAQSLCQPAYLLCLPELRHDEPARAVGAESESA